MSGTRSGECEEDAVWLTADFPWGAVTSQVFQPGRCVRPSAVCNQHVWDKHLKHKQTDRQTIIHSPVLNIHTWQIITHHQIQVWGFHRCKKPSQRNRSDVWFLGLELSSDNLLSDTTSILVITFIYSFSFRNDDWSNQSTMTLAHLLIIDHNNQSNRTIQHTISLETISKMYWITTFRSHDKPYSNTSSFNNSTWPISHHYQS